MRDRLIQWLLGSRVPCYVGIHMPVSSLHFEDDEIVEDGRRCAACGKILA